MRLGTKPPIRTSRPQRQHLTKPACNWECSQ